MDEYKKIEKEFQDIAPKLMNSFGISDKDIKECISTINAENNKRDEIIEELKKNYDLSIYRQDFPVMIYSIDAPDDKKIFIEHDCSRWIYVYYNERTLDWDFDPLEENCFKNICNHIDDILKNKDIKI